MSKWTASLSEFGIRLRQSYHHLVTGGEWVLSFPDQIRHNLHAFWYDGLFASACDNIIITYITLYVLALGATRAQIGLMSSLSALSAALLLLPGAMLVERFQHRRELTLLFGGIISRSGIILLALAPFALHGQPLVYVAMALSVSRDAFANLAYPAWVSITADIVPMAGRGRYFGSRNFVMGVAGMLTVLLVGELITRIGQPAGYQWAIGLAFVLGMASTYSFSRLRDPGSQAFPQTKASFALPGLLRDLRSHPGFLSLVLTAAVWNFFLNIPGPFFNVYMVENLKASAAFVGIASVISSIASLLVQRRLGKLVDRIGAHRMQLISGLLVPILPLAWVFVRVPWHILPINIAGGVIWGAYGLASFNLLLEMTPPEQRARYSAIYQIVVTVALAGGAAVGSLMVTQWGYIAIFVTSAIGRLLAALLYARFVPRPAIAQETD